MANQLELTLEYVSTVTDELGSDPKAMLLGPAAMSAVSIACLQSTLMDRMSWPACQRPHSLSGHGKLIST